MLLKGRDRSTGSRIAMSPAAFLHLLIRCCCLLDKSHRKDKHLISYFLFCITFKREIDCNDYYDFMKFLCSRFDLQGSVVCLPWSEIVFVV